MRHRRIGTLIRRIAVKMRHVNHIRRLSRDRREREARQVRIGVRFRSRAENGKRVNLKSRRRFGICLKSTLTRQLRAETAEAKARNVVSVRTTSIVIINFGPCAGCIITNKHRFARVTV